MYLQRSPLSQWPFDPVASVAPGPQDTGFLSLLLPNFHHISVSVLVILLHKTQASVFYSYVGHQEFAPETYL